MNTRTVAILVVAVVLLISFFALSRRDEDPVPAVLTRFTADEAQELAKRRNLGLAYLENERYADADPELLFLTEQLPEEEFGPRNLSINRLLALEAAPPEEAAERTPLLFEALEQWEGRTEDRAAWHVIRSRGAKAAGDTELAIAEMEAAIEAQPENAAAHYELHDLLKLSNVENAAGRADAALIEAYRLQPENVFLLTEVMVVQATNQSPELAETAENAVELLAPFFESIQTNTRVDLQSLLAEVPQQVADGDWGAATRTARITANVIRPEAIAQTDRRRVQPHSLEFALFDFSPDLLAQLQEATAPEAAEVEGIDMVFTELEVADLGEGYPEQVRQLALADMNLDGQAEMVLLFEDRIAVLQGAAGNVPNGVWPVTMEVELPAGSAGFELADLDHDADAPKEDHAQTVCPEADTDLVVYGTAGLTVVRNEFSAETGTRSLNVIDAAIPEELAGMAVALIERVDIDADGDLDLAVAPASGDLQILFNRGNATFERLDDSPLLPEGLAVTALQGVDWDRDVDIDVLIAGSQPGLLENLRYGRVRFRPFEEDEYEALVDATSLQVIDDDGWFGWEVIAGNGQRWRRISTRRLPNGMVQPVEVTSAAAPARAADLLDAGNDGFVDLLAVGNGGFSVWQVDAGGEPARRYASPEGMAAGTVSNVAVLDASGQQGFVVLNDDGLQLVQAASDGEQNSLAITLRAQQEKGEQSSASGRVNHLGIGSVVELRVADRIQTRMVDSAITHFGLGDRETADAVRVMWTNGVPRHVIQPEANQLICEEQVLKGSCPYLYGWDGERFVFITDLLWAAPIGLKFAHDFVAPWKASEYLKVDGRFLQPKEGSYVLQITEELWEATYFDQVELLAIDHPADVAIYTNEKVASSQSAEHKLYTVRRPLVPASATLASGRDVRDEIATRDERYLKPFEDRIRQGLTDDWSLELSLDGVKRDDRVTLFLTGWVFPADTSLNVANSRNPTLPRSQPPSLWVQNAEGEWVEALPMMGFPGGKTKTIAVELTGELLTDNPRLQIRSNMELYWDQVFYTVNDQPAEFTVTPLALQSADLHPRGVSAYEHADHNGPDRYLYDQVRTTPAWPPMRGTFTRFGDVKPLLTEVDDHLAVIGAGDEITVRFEAVPDPPEGWVRDFVIHCVGWDKDADLNTVYGESVEPLPFHAMTDYAHTNGLPRPADPEYEAYLKTYQTRRMSPVEFWSTFRSETLPAAHD